MLNRQVLKSGLIAMVLGAFGAGAVPALRAADAASSAGPQELVENSAKKMLVELDANRAVYRKDSAKLENLVSTVLLPYFDTDYAARLVLGPHWRTANEEQRKRFIDAFYHSLLHNYGSALIDFTADRMNVLPFRGDPAATQATVRTEVKRSNGSKVPVNYTLHRTDAGWKAWDVTIEGISYVKSFKTDLGAEVQQKGLDEVIQRLEAEARAEPKAAAKTEAKAASKSDSKGSAR